MISIKKLSVFASTKKLSTKLMSPMNESLQYHHLQLEIINLAFIASPHPNHVLDLFEAMFSGNCPSPRVGEANVKDRGRGSIAQNCLSARTEKFNPKNDLGVT